MNISKEVVYQIYPKSFQDSNGDGIGDLQGIISRLDYFKDLGVTTLWLNPIYPSPQHDNGYDISDYTAIDPMFGTMEDFEQLVAEAKKRDIKIMLDMVFNHTSDEHPWFQKALQGDPYYKDFYIWKKARPDGSLLTNWVSKFGGPVWVYVPEFDEYYLHLYDKSQPDLNWENPNVRKALKDVLRFWLDKGVGGFRFDVINVISKGSYENATSGEGKEFYTDGPNVNKWIHELYEDVLKDADVMTVGEMSNTTIDHCADYSRPENEELSMCFNFHHLKVDYENGQKWTKAPFDFLELKRLLNTWDVEMEKEGGWNALFWNCHDQPRSISRFGDPENYPKESAKMLATVLLTRRGTPYLLMGEELGQTNLNRCSIDEYVDVESRNAAEIMKHDGKTEDEIVEILNEKSRDHGRALMQWNKDGGFGSDTPWIKENDNANDINAEDQMNDPDSVRSYYQKLIEFKKESPILQNGTTIPVLEDDPSIYGYRRVLDGQELLILHNFYGHEASCPLDLGGYEVVMSNYADSDPASGSLRPYESIILEKTNQADK